MAELTQSENEAVIRLMLAVRYEDKKISIPESAALTDLVREMTWKSGTSPEIFIAQSTAQVRKAIAEESTRKTFLMDQCGAFNDDESCEIALQCIDAVARADGITPEESKLLQQIHDILMK